MEKVFTDIYLKILTEDQQLVVEEPQETPENKEEQNPQDVSNDQTLDTNSETNSETNDEFEDDGWEGILGGHYEDVLDLSEKLEDFTYEIKNCQRGSFTNANSKEELADYMNSLAEELNSYAEILRG